MTDSNLVGRTTGNSAGFSPLRTLPAQMPAKPETKKAAVTATLYRLPIADSAYGKVDCLGGSRCPNFHLQRDPHARGKFASVRLNFPPTRSRLSGSLSGIPLLRSSANSLSKHWQISVGAVLTPQSYSGFRSAPCGTRSTTTMGVENQCLNQRSIE